MKIIYIGSSSPLSLTPLEQLLISIHQVCAIALPAESLECTQDPRFPITLERPGSIESLARSNEIPLIRLPLDLSQSLVQIKQFEPDVILVSCFPRKLPMSILSVPTVGCFNLHPSLLPAHRGPTPLFWQFRDGRTEFGVTLHRMSLQLDAGNIIGQSAVTIPDGVTMGRANSLLATAGCQLIARALTDFEQAAVHGIPQDEDIASYQGFPSESDFAVSSLWTAKRLFNFIRATSEPGRIYPCTVAGHVYPLLKAMSYQESGNAKMVATSTTVTIPCAQGSIIARFLAD
ncbi:MAG: hypothetical protein NZ729_06165 [Methylococcales bacterium]|nr:hypothetical protein [Methylococcales bacterium]